MKTILLGWDLGEGFSYVLQLRQIADALAAAGHRPVLALRSLEAVGDLLADRPHPVVQAPWLIGRVHGEAAVQGLYPTGFADLMAVNGFSSVDHLLSMQRGWRDLIDVVRPDLVVGFSDIQADFDAALEGIRRLPVGTRLGVYLAYKYYTQLFAKIKNAQAHHIAQQRFRVSDKRKFYLLCSSALRHQFDFL